MNAALFWQFVNERHAIYVRKELRAGADPASLHVPEGADLEECDPQHRAGWDDGPLTDDEVLATYSFCNVFRELDRVTRWIDRNIRQPYAEHPNLWVMLAIARTINWPPTLQFLMNRSLVKTRVAAWPHEGTEGMTHLQFSPEALGKSLDDWKGMGNKIHTGAYMIRAPSKRDPFGHWSKQRYLGEIVIGRLWEDRAEWKATLGSGAVPPPECNGDQCIKCQDSPGWCPQPSMEAVWEAFQHPKYVGWGPFMAYQVVVDMRHTRYLRNAPDINTWAAVGPGSRRGLNRLAGRPLDFNLRQDDALGEMREIWAEQDRYRAPWVPRIELSDIQNCLCETDKLLRVRNGEGKPRSRYVPGRQTF